MKLTGISLVSFLYWSSMRDMNSFSYLVLESGLKCGQKWGLQSSQLVFSVAVASRVYEFSYTDYDPELQYRRNLPCVANTVPYKWCPICTLYQADLLTRKGGRGKRLLPTASLEYNFVRLHPMVKRLGAQISVHIKAWTRLPNGWEGNPTVSIHGFLTYEFSQCGNVRLIISYLVHNEWYLFCE